MIYNIFISHSWAYSQQYNNLVWLLNSDPYFKWKDYSVPRYDPIHTNGTVNQLREAIKAQMAPTSCILILTGVYATYSRWINEEIGLAKNGFLTPKRIIAINPWGADRTSMVVRNAADVIVNWQASSIIKAIRDY